MDFHFTTKPPFNGGLCAPATDYPVVVSESAEITPEAWDSLRGAFQPDSPERVAAMGKVVVMPGRVHDGDCWINEGIVHGAERQVALKDLPAPLDSIAAPWPVPPTTPPSVLALEDAPSMQTGGRGSTPNAPASSPMSRAFRLAVPSDDPRLGAAAFMPREE